MYWLVFTLAEAIVRKEMYTTALKGLQLPETQSTLHCPETQATSNVMAFLLAIAEVFPFRIIKSVLTA